MNFFERQRAARGTSLRLVLLFVAAVVAIVVLIDVIMAVLLRSQSAGSLVPMLIASTAFTLLLIAGGTISKTLSLRAGGSAVALSVGAVPVDPTTSDPALRRYVNVVEEMSLASGIPMPRLFVLEQEAGINAFAAGFTPADAAITVTGGTLHQLNRDELQGVIGHEFSHILNGDMRLNVQLIGLLAGILLLGLVGLRILAFGGGGRDSKKGPAPILVLAIAMLILGFVGQFFAGLIKAAVSRQREWLADASAVQFTRQTTGLAGALKKIAGLPTGSRLANKRGASEVSHLLFGEGGASLSSLYATHPPLLQRIAALDPSFTADQLPALGQRWSDQAPNGLSEDAALGLTAGASAGIAPTRGAAPPVVAAPVAEAISSRVGSMSAADLERGVRLSGQLPAQLRVLANQPTTAVPLVLALALNAEQDVRDRQLQMITDVVGRANADAAAALRGELDGLAPLLRLPLISIAVPMTAARPRAAVEALVTALDAMARADGVVSVFEYCLTRMIASYLRDATDPVGRSRPGRRDVASIQTAALTLLAAVAAAGNGDPTAAERAFTAAVSHLLPGAAVPYAPPRQPWRALDAGWDPLDSLDPLHKQQLVDAVMVAVCDDGVLQAEEAELLRTTCALLHCPLPSLVA